MYPQDQPPQTFYPQQGPSPAGTPPPLTSPPNNERDDSSHKKTYIIIACISVVILLLIIVVLVMAAGKSPSKKATPAPVKGNSTTGSVAPATWLTLQQNSDAINQNLSNLSDTTDFPTNALSDRTLTAGH